MTRHDIPDEWCRFVDATRSDDYKDAVLGGSALPKWMLKAMLARPLVSAVAVAIVTATFATTDRPMDRPFVIGLAVTMALAIVISSLLLRHRVRQAMGTQTIHAEEPPSHVTIDRPCD